MSDESKSKLNMELRSEAARKEFNVVGENATHTKTATHDHHHAGGSNQVLNGKTIPELKMQGEVGAEADRQKHQAEMRTDNQIAQERNLRAQELIEEVKLKRDFNAAAQARQNQNQKNSDLER